MFVEPLGNLPNSPDYFRMYRYFNSCGEMKRIPGGWRYRGKNYPDYLFVGGASCAVFGKAKILLKGKDIDVGAVLWPLPGATPVDIERGEGTNHKIEDFKNKSLDYVFSSHCLEHISDWESALIKWIELLKDGGRLFLYLPHPDCLIWRRGAPGIGDGHEWIPKIEMLRKFMIKNSMKIIEEDIGPDSMMSFYICAEK